MAFEIIEIDNQKDFQDLKIPEKFKINDNKVYIKKVGDALYIIPFHNAWDGLISATRDFTSDFMENRGQLPDQQRETFDQ